MLLNRSAAPLASVLLVALVAVIATLNVRTGFIVYLAETYTDCNDDTRLVVLTLEGSDVVRINQESVSMKLLRNRLHEIFRTRAERVVFVRADPEVPYGGLVDLLDAAAPEVSKFGLITPAMDAQLGNCNRPALPMAPRIFEFGR